MHECMNDFFERFCIDRTMRRETRTGDEGRRRAPSPPPPPPVYAYESQGTEMYEWDTRGYIVLRCANRSTM